MYIGIKITSEIEGTMFHLVRYKMILKFVRLFLPPGIPLFLISHLDQE